MISAYFADTGFGTIDLFIMLWLPFYHDMGLVLGVCADYRRMRRRSGRSPVVFLAATSPVHAIDGTRGPGALAAPNFAFELTAAKQ